MCPPETLSAREGASRRPLTLAQLGFRGPASAVFAGSATNGGGVDAPRADDAA